MTKANVVYSRPAITNSAPKVEFASLMCTLLGHKVDHTTVVANNSYTPCARCGAAILGWRECVSRVAHTLSCFFGSHHYIPIARRAGHNEYVCETCGHPLLFQAERDPYSGHNKFNKRVNYGCGIFGHRVHVVTRGFKTTEYACRCGHSFVKTETELTVIRHPVKCVLLGHFISINVVRSGWAEYLCFRCGHPFCFRLAKS